MAELGKPKNKKEADLNPVKEYTLKKDYGKKRLKLKKGGKVYLTDATAEIFKKKELI
tara:strand:- start:4372 stop:4542 length:171 start_codon:yes stop_codon:yes gene_type:complete